MWKSEQQTETELLPTVIESQTRVIEERAAIERQMALKAQEHKHMMDVEERRSKIKLVAEGKAVFKLPEKEE